ncbi:MAG TPA: isochorismate synthase [Flavobacterium sp.]|nr:isochorismate synthase [Flavobacterium sp.]
MAQLFKKAAEQLENKLPFVLYSKPGEKAVVGIFQQTDTLYLMEDFDAQGFVFAPFDGQDALFIPESASLAMTEENAGANVPETPAMEDAKDAFDSEAKEKFEHLAGLGIEAIYSGALKKVVLSRKETVTVKDNALLLFKRLAAKYPEAFRYCFFHPKAGLWLGATPEQLLKSDGAEIRTVALAGTQVYREGEFVWEPKEKEEQQLVADFIAGSLKGFAASIGVSAPYTFKAGNIVHIKTDIKAVLKDKRQLHDVIRILHPTPAVCGLPKEEARAFINANEGYAREYYSGFLGEVNKDFAKSRIGSSDLFVNLRCMKIHENKAALFIGCGITKDSIPEKEFFETVNKSLTMKAILA